MPGFLWPQVSFSEAKDAKKHSSGHHHSHGHHSHSDKSKHHTGGHHEKKSPGQTKTSKHPAKEEDKDGKIAEKKDSDKCYAISTTSLATMTARSATIPRGTAPTAPVLYNKGGEVMSAPVAVHYLWVGDWSDKQKGIVKTFISSLSTGDAGATCKGGKRTLLVYMIANSLLLPFDSMSHTTLI